MIKTCLYCGTEITGRGNAAKYCSGKCARKAERHKRIKTISAKARNINKVKLLIYSGYNCKCAVCGWQATSDLIQVNGKWQDAHGNEIHHIIPVSEGGTEQDNNLILLCPNHHKMAHMNLLTREHLQSLTKHIFLTDKEQEEHRANNTCADTIARAIFG